MKVLLILIALSITTLSNAQLQPEKRMRFSAREIKEDLAYLYSNLEAAHFNLYVNNSKKIFDKAFIRLQDGIKDSMSLLEITRIFQPFTALSEIGHCNISFPFNDCYVPFVMGGGKVFPFDVTVKNRHIWVTENFTSDTSIEKGDEILEIEGVSTAKRLASIYKYLSGENELLKNTQIDLIYFPRIWWLVFGPDDLYTVKVRKLNGSIITRQVKAVGALEYETKAATKPSIINASRSFSFINDIAYLHPGQFLNNETGSNSLGLRGLEKGEFFRFIDSSFLQIRIKNASHLIIDLRGNPGGDNSFSDGMVAYFANNPFWFCSKFLVKTSSQTRKFWEQVNDTLLADLKEKILTHKDGEIFEASIDRHLPVPDSLLFKGKVFVLVNRYSFSNAVTTAAMIQDYKFGTLIGEQTADLPTTYAAVHQFNLPHTGIAVIYPKAFMVRPNCNKLFKGVMPDHVVPEGADILEYACKLMVIPDRAGGK